MSNSPSLGSNQSAASLKSAPNKRGSKLSRKHHRRAKLRAERTKQAERAKEKNGNSFRE